VAPRSHPGYPKSTSGEWRPEIVLEEVREDSGGLNSFVINGNCAGLGFGYRVDTDEVYQWIFEVTGDMLPTASL